ncbi:MAG: ABC transporter ATP-binding protein [Deltaproteobacteria bacterium]|nr:ABC transporter ATP-binding protein [Deltaproteobacteria bacterium]
MILNNIDLEISAGEFIAIIGASGVGKSTLLSVMSGLDAVFDGEVKFDGRSVKAMSDDERARLRNESFGFVFQSFHLLEHLTVAENVALPLWLAKKRLAKVRRGRVARREEDGEGDRVRKVLERVGLSHIPVSASVRRLSGGERQRVAIARAIIHGPDVLFADEPTGNLDDATSAMVGSLFDSLRQEVEQADRGDRGHRSRCAIVVATHDARLVRRCDRAFRLADGRLEEVSRDALLDASAN